MPETKRRRSAFLDEFYAGRERPSLNSRQEEEDSYAEYRSRKNGAPLWVLAGVSAIAFCIIAVGGSSAMIWLKNLATLFDVHWAGD